MGSAAQACGWVAASGVAAVSGKVPADAATISAARCTRRPLRQAFATYGVLDEDGAYAQPGVGTDSTWFARSAGVRHTTNVLDPAAGPHRRGPRPQRVPV